MKKNSNSFAMNEKNYVSPDMEIIEIISEGVLCASGDGDINDRVPGEDF